MIRRIRSQFIRIALVVLALAMALVALVINAANWIDVRSGLHETLDALCQDGGRPGMEGGRFNRNGGRFGPESTAGDLADERPALGGKGMRSRSLLNRMSEARFFSVSVSDAGEISLNDIAREAEYSSEELLAIAKQAMQGGRTGGFAGDYLFSTAQGEDGRRFAVFLNCETKLNAVRRLAVISAGAWLLGVLLAWALVAKSSNRAIQPLIENAVRQKQFITDAGHELKTPLTVISANMDVLQLETGENEWIRSTQKQVAGLRGLVNELIYLSRLDEEDSRLQMVELDLEKLARETAEPFAAMAEFSGKSLSIAVEGRTAVRGDGPALSRMLSVLCDNAVKYAPEGDSIQLALRGDGRRVILTLENGLAAPMDPEVLRHLFDRFYRADASRSKQSGGYGIGLSIAQAVAEKHGGSIAVRQAEGPRLRFTVTLPAARP